MHGATRIPGYAEVVTGRMGKRRVNFVAYLLYFSSFGQMKISFMNASGLCSRGGIYDFVHISTAPVCSSIASQRQEAPVVWKQ
jgi:hypothetical protein